MKGVKYIGPQKSSLFSFAEPVTAAIISTLVLGSPFTVWDAIGFVCIFLMLVLLFISNEKAGQKRCKRMITGQVSTKPLKQFNICILHPRRFDTVPCAGVLY